MLRHRAAVVLAAALVLTACGASGSDGAGGTGSPTTPAASASSAAPTLPAFLLAVNDRLAALPGFTTVETTANATTTTTGYGDDHSTTLVSAVYGNATALVVGGETWIRGDELFWRLSVDSFDPAEVEQLAAPLIDRWVLVTGTDAAGPFSQALPVPFKHPDDTTKAGSDTVDGRPVDLYDDPIAAATIAVTTDDAPLPVEIELPDAKVLTFSDLGTTSAVVASPAAEVVDGRDTVR